VELRPELLLPLKLEARRHNDEHSVNEFAGPKLLDDETRFDGLSESDLVSKDHPRLDLLRDAMGYIHLVQLWLDARDRQACERVVSVGVSQIQGLEPKRIGLCSAEDPGRQELGRV